MRLALVLSYATFSQEMLGESEKARRLAQAGFDRAVGDMYKLDSEVFRESAEFMQALRDKLSMWAPKGEDEEEEL